MTGPRTLVPLVTLAMFCLACGTPTSPVAVDVDGNTYPVIRLGSQVWLADNLRATRTPEGAPLRTFPPNNDAANVAAFGRLYSWQSARQACPAGWHLPSDEEWTTLERFLGGAAARRLRDPGYWPAGTLSREGAVPFRARPAGYSNDQGFDNFFGSRAVFWTASPMEQEFAWSRVLSSDQDALLRAGQHPHYGFSVRCISDR